MGKRVRRQHVVSQFYLKGFANDASRVRRVTLPGDQDLVLSTSDATVIKDFYTITLPNGAQSDAFEKAFSDMEGPAAEALRAVLAGTWPVTGERRAAIATWVALQYLRTADIRANQGAMNAEFIRLIVGVSGKEALRHVIEKAESRSISDEELDWEWQDITKPGGPDLMPNVRQHLQLLKSMLARTGSYLHDCHWTLIQFSRRALITSDHPVSLVTRPSYPTGQGVGLATADLFLLPLARRLALTIQPRDRLPSGAAEVPDFRVTGSTKMARSINQETAAQARNYIYHHPEDSPLQGLFLPDPESRQPGTSTSDDLIREEGIFSGMTKEQLKPLARATGPGNSGKGMSINDLPWPIPGRKKPSQTVDAGPAQPA